MSVLGKPKPMPYVDEEDLLEVAADLGPGVFPSSDIYEWHADILEKAGREAVPKNTFGAALKEAGWRSSVRVLDGKPTRCWMITRPWFRRGMAHIGADASKILDAPPRGPVVLDPTVDGWEGDTETGPDDPDC